jgi:hypothetical protein
MPIVSTAVMRGFNLRIHALQNTTLKRRGYPRQARA